MAEAPSPSTTVVREYLGLYAAAGLGTFALLAGDAAAAPDVHQRLVLSRMAAGRLAGTEKVEELAASRNADIEALLEDYSDLMKDFLARAVPRDWWERLVRSYVGFNLLEDLLVELSEELPDEIKALARSTAGESGHADYVVGVLTPVLDKDELLRSRLALWGRRCVGEALSLVKELFAAHPEMGDLLTGDGDGDGAARVQRLTARLRAGPARRLLRLRLTS